MSEETIKTEKKRKVQIELDPVIEEPLWPGETKEPSDDERQLLPECKVVGEQLRKATLATWALQEKIGEMGSISLIRSLMCSGGFWCGTFHLSRKLAQYGHLSAIEFMIQWDKLESSAASEVAAEYKQIKVLQLLQKYNQKHSSLTFGYALNSGSEDLIKYLLDIGFRPNSFDMERAQKDNLNLYEILKPYENQKTDPKLISIPEIRRM